MQNKHFRFDALVRRLATCLIAICVMVAFATPARADVDVTFHSFNGSVLWGRYPHTFVVFKGTLAAGHTVDENFGFSAKYTSQAITSKPAEHVILHEDPDDIAGTNNHFTVRVSDAKYREMRAEIERWRTYPGRYYDLDERNCIHFVARMAEMVGLRAPVPSDYLRRPKAWLNYVTRLNPNLGAREID